MIVQESNRRTGLIIVGAVILSATAAIVLSSADRADPPQSAPAPPAGAMMSTPFVVPGKNRPPTLPAARATLASSEPVVGVIVHGKARAYCQRAFGAPHHVVNDVLDGVPITVTFCDLDRCSRVYTGPGVEPLPIMTGGYSGGLLLKVNNLFYVQQTGRQLNFPDAAIMPYTTVAFEETTWAEWRAAHPDTDVYAGHLQPADPKTKKE